MALIMAGRTCLAASSASAQSPNIQVPLDGPSVFKVYCAACHGADGKGHGPAADALKAKPIDLTRIAINNKGMFPRATIEDILTNGGKWKAHGSKEMPTWGPIFRAVDKNDNIAAAHIHNLVTYLESIQVKVASSGGSVSPRPVSAASPGTRPSALPVLYVGLVGLQALDAYSTLRAVSAGAREMNPLVGGLASHPTAFWSVKAASTALAIYLGEQDWRHGHRNRAVVTMVIANGLMAAIALRNRHVIAAGR